MDKEFLKAFKEMVKTIVETGMKKPDSFLILYDVAKDKVDIFKN